ncbi:hypothetical protein M408DRAFT_327197 [Serendipita vermifera MAFF 305830]|uniref:Uncharacterized protein n=1 Tax=Serendipita vermifera MAFF 305830 TaxID=933852 RepID=A0A0C3B4I6_SERVB|nr:hypothetical protein M408DRAFT_327197 [Serendipita vermifera MAFF 305830]
MTTQTNAEIEEIYVPSHGMRHRLGNTDDDDLTSRAGPSNKNDVELQPTSAYSTAISSSLDPYSLKAGLKTDGDLQNLKKSKKKKAGAYYEKQNELIGDLLRPLEEHVENARAAERANRLPVKIALYGSLGANIALSALQLYAAITSLSLSILATAIDSVFDPLGNGLLWYLHRKSKRLDNNKWPVGGERLTTIGNIAYGSVMAAINLVVCVESVRTFISHKDEDGETNQIVIPALVSVSAALGVKIILFCYCFLYRKHSTQVEMLYQDHRNDLFVNTFGILMSAGGSKIKWYIDPMGGFIVRIAFGVIIAWCRTIYHEFELLAGKSAPHEFLQLIIYKSATFSDEIEKIDTVRAYHTGPDLFVEVDIVMAGTTPLSAAHDLSQQLQDKLELLPGVARAFVHVDHETTHKPEHRRVE